MSGCLLSTNYALGTTQPSFHLSVAKMFGSFLGAFDNSDDPDIPDANGMTALHLAAENNSLNRIRTLLNVAGINVNVAVVEGPFKGYTALHLAAGKGHVEVVKLLLDAGADVNALDEEDCAALHLAAMKGHAEVVRALLRAPGADANATDAYGRTALHLAAEKGCREVVRVLLRAGINVNAMVANGPKRGWTALHYAASSGILEAIEEVLGAPGINANVMDNRGRTPLDLVPDKIRVKFFLGKINKVNPKAAEARDLLKEFGAKTGAEILQERNGGFFRRFISFWYPGARTV
ncbi:MAG: ankyrin repeat domain-containing protein [Puniceicoccales bacterium]|nr:ankyrin repeat domain-containing protein [Puniceicoccales bacterium]